MSRKPLSFTPEVEKYMVSLVGQYGVSRAKAILAGKDRVSKTQARLGAVAVERDLSILPEALEISSPSLTRIAKAAGVCINRGRPTLYTGEVESHIADLIRGNGLLRTMQILQANPRDMKGHFTKDITKMNPTCDAAKRDLNLIPKALEITMPTLSKIAVSHGITLKMGRRVGAVESQEAVA